MREPVRFRYRVVVLALIAFALLSDIAAGQGYPIRPIRFIMAYPPGGSSDLLARPIAHEMSKSLGQQVLIDYKPGGGTTIAADLVAKSPADGYTIIMLLTAHAINATLVPKLPYDTLKDFAPITLAALQPLIVVVNAQSPIRSIQELIAAAKANPDVPTMQEAGVPGFDVAVWYGIFARAGTPPDIIKRLNAEVIKAMHAPEAKERIETAGNTIVGSPPEALDAHVKVEIARWGKVIREGGISVE